MVTLFFIRHGHPVPVKGKPPQEWELSSQGKIVASSLPNQITELNKVKILYASGEKKAIQTAESIINSIPGSKRPELKLDTRLNEVDRSQGTFYETPEEFQQAIKLSFLKLHEPVNAWESSISALRRFNEFIREIKTIYQNEKKNPIAFVTHGTIMNLYLAQQGYYIDKPEKIFKIWSSTPFCGWFREENNIMRKSW